MSVRARQGGMALFHMYASFGRVTADWRRTTGSTRPTHNTCVCGKGRVPVCLRVQGYMQWTQRCLRSHRLNINTCMENYHECTRLQQCSAQEGAAAFRCCRRPSSLVSVPCPRVWRQGVGVEGRHWKVCSGGGGGWLEEEARGVLLLPPARPSSE